MLTIGSLFSGIGGLEYGLEAGLLRAGLSSRVAWQVEKEEYCRQVLAKHWPEAVRHEDIRQCKDLPHVDIICGGFPCQDISTAGTMQGLEGARSGLFYEAARIIHQTQPRYVVLENVAALVNNGMASILRAMACSGYHARWGMLSAADVGAPHQRQRWFCIAWMAYPGEGGSQMRSTQSEYCHVWQGSAQAGRQQQTKPGVGRNADGLPCRLDGHQWPARPGCAQYPYEPSRTRKRQQHDKQRIKALGNAVVPACAAVIGEYLAELVQSHS